jgi:hypothetical protein
MSADKEAQAGLVRVMRGKEAAAADPDLWEKEVSAEYRRILLEGVVEVFVDTPSGERKRVRKGMSKEEAEREKAEPEKEKGGTLSLGRMLLSRVRYFLDGLVIGSREFVDEAHANKRECFGAKRKTGARMLRGVAAPAAGVIWSMRDLKKGI